MTVLVEACVDSVASALAAEHGGAGRLELCDDIVEGGTTPSAGMISAVKASVRIPVFVLVRPRGGGFVYTHDETGVMRLDIEAARMLGADGVVAGALRSDATVDAEQMQLLAGAAGGMPLTFHRAFDLTRDRHAALETLIHIGVARVLTSGGAASALAGVEELGALVRRAAGQIAIMAGGGVREETVQEIVHRSGVREVHVRGTRPARTPMTPEAAIPLRKSPAVDESAWEETDERRIREYVRLANG